MLVGVAIGVGAGGIVVTGGWVFAAAVAAVILALGFVAAHRFCARAFSAPGSSGTPAWRLAVWTGTIATRPAVRTRSCKRTPPGTTPAPHHVAVRVAAAWAIADAAAAMVGWSVVAVAGGRAKGTSVTADC
jgi:hypothetical protein